MKEATTNKQFNWIVEGFQIPGVLNLLRILTSIKFIYGCDILDELESLGVGDEIQVDVSAKSNFSPIYKIHHFIRIK